MKSIRRTSIAALVLLVGTLVAEAKPNGPNSMRYSVDTVLVSTGVDEDAAGRVQISQHKGAAADQYRVRISVTGLDARTGYTVLAQLGEDPNFVVVTNFTTNPRGSARIVYVSGKNGNSKRALPEAVAPVLNVRALAVANTNGEIVLSVDLHKSESMKFELASIFENTGTDMLAIGCVALAYQNGSIQFRLFAGASSSQLTFCVNGTPVETYSTDLSGRINVGLFPSGAPSPLEFRTLSLRNGDDAVVLQSEVR